MKYNSNMKKLLLLLTLSFFSTIGYGDAASPPSDLGPAPTTPDQLAAATLALASPPPAPGAPTAAENAAKAAAVSAAETASAATAPGAPTAAENAAKAAAVRIAEMNAAVQLTPDQLAAAPAPATDQITPASAPAPANDDLCGAEESTSTPKDISDGVNISCSDDVEITEAPAPVPTRRPDMFSTAVVKYANTMTTWAEMGIPAAIVKKYLKDPTGTPSDAINATKAMNVAAAEAASAASAAAAEGAETAAESAAKAAAVSAAEAASAASAAASFTAAQAAAFDAEEAAKASAVAAAEAESAAQAATACDRLPEGETADYC